MKSLHSKKDLLFFVRPNFGISILVLFVFTLFTACTGNQKENEAKARPMVYEGMSAGDLENILGQPIKIDSSGSVFDANKGKTIKVQKWYYEKRTVVLIDDTVITPNLPDIN